MRTGWKTRNRNVTETGASITVIVEQRACKGERERGRERDSKRLSTWPRHEITPLSTKGLFKSRAFRGRAFFDNDFRCVCTNHGPGDENPPPRASEADRVQGHGPTTHSPTFYFPARGRSPPLVAERARGPSFSSVVNFHFTRRLVARGKS